MCSLNWANCWKTFIKTISRKILNVIIYPVLSSETIRPTSDLGLMI
uniref:Unclassified n=2 Tax=Fusarium sambucinum species complex TaxID=569360 RepID=W1I7M8_FUSPS|nr:unclassified [Fusarium pseudograminearum CS3220]CDL73549.1 unclassified [Fusarium culmorum CS7071]CDX48510.1 unclassified [Fusarium pseudograminearum CS3220]